MDSRHAASRACIHCNSLSLHPLTDRVRGTVINRPLKNVTRSWQIFFLDAKSIGIARLTTQTEFSLKEVCLKSKTKSNHLPKLFVYFDSPPSCKTPLLTTLNS